MVVSAPVLSDFIFFTQSVITSLLGIKKIGSVECYEKIEVKSLSFG
jgi:hypothetical protein